MNIGERIEKLLGKNNLSQRDLAKTIGLDESVVSRIISGSRFPKMDTIANLATALHTTSDYLLGIENEDFNFNETVRLIARNSSKMSEAEKKKLINALFEED